MKKKKNPIDNILQHGELIESIESSATTKYSKEKLVHLNTGEWVFAIPFQ